MQAEQSKADPPKRKRRRFQFRLRTLMIAVTILAACCGAVVWIIRSVPAPGPGFDIPIVLGLTWIGLRVACTRS